MELDITKFFYRKYTQSNCLFECQLKDASSKCQCVPWDYPQVERMPICDRFGRECFLIIMTNASLGNTCDCPLDCETKRYYVLNIHINILVETVLVGR